MGKLGPSKYYSDEIVQENQERGGKFSKWAIVVIFSIFLWKTLRAARSTSVPDQAPTYAYSMSIFLGIAAPKLCTLTKRIATECSTSARIIMQVWQIRGTITIISPPMYSALNTNWLSGSSCCLVSSGTGKILK